MARENFGSATGRPAKACAGISLFCFAEHPDTTFEDLQDSGECENTDCKLAAGLPPVLSTGFRHRMKNLRALEHKADR
eukprot:3087653-Pyramimonas_sp.AAC.1